MHLYLKINDAIVRRLISDECPPRKRTLRRKAGQIDRRTAARGTQSRGRATAPGRQTGANQPTAVAPRCRHGTRRRGDCADSQQSADDSSIEAPHQGGCSAQPPVSIAYSRSRTAGAIDLIVNPPHTYLGRRCGVTYALVATGAGGLPFRRQCLGATSAERTSLADPSAQGRCLHQATPITNFRHLPFATSSFVQEGIRCAMCHLLNNQLFYE